MAHFSNWAESGILNWLFRSNSNSFTRPAGLGIALCGNVPHEGQNGQTIPELPNAAGYNRYDLGAPTNSLWSEVTQSALGSGFINNATTITFGPATANWGWVSGVAILNSGVHGSGEVLMMAALPVPREVLADDTITYSVDRFAINLG